MATAFQKYRSVCALAVAILAFNALGRQLLLNRDGDLPASSEPRCRRFINQRGARLAGAPYAPDPVFTFPDCTIEAAFQSNRCASNNILKNVPRLKWVFQIAVRS